VDGDRLYKGDEGNALRFFYRSDQNNFQTETTGRKQFDTVLMVEVISPGSKESIPTFECERIYCAACDIPEPKRSMYYEKYEAQIAAFKNAEGADAALEGTPIETWPLINVGMADTLKAAKIFTVEQLATVPDSQLTGIGPGSRDLREKAHKYVLAMSGGAEAAAVSAELAGVKADLLAAQATIKERDEQIDALTRELHTAKAQAQPEPPPPAMVDNGGLGVLSTDKPPAAPSKAAKAAAAAI
jgi:hypothetical protein